MPRSLAGTAAAAAWGFAEGTLFFIVPDVLVSRAALTSWRRAMGRAAAAVAGALVAGAVLFTWADRAPATARAAVGNVPFVRERWFASAGAALDSNPFSALLAGSFGGIPYKVFAVEAPGRVSPSRFLLASAPARGVRFVVVGSAVALLAAQLRRRFAVRPATLKLAHALAWVVFYAGYWLTV